MLCKKKYSSQAFTRTGNGGGTERLMPPTETSMTPGVSANKGGEPVSTHLHTYTSLVHRVIHRLWSDVYDPAFSSLDTLCKITTVCNSYLLLVTVEAWDESL